MRSFYLKVSFGAAGMATLIGLATVLIASEGPGIGRGTLSAGIFGLLSIASWAIASLSKE